MVGSNFKGHCSMLGILMTSENIKDKLAVTTKTYLQELHKEAVFGYRKDITNLYISKGNLSEPDSIKLLSEVHDRPFDSQYIKNEEFFENDFIVGTPDIHIEDSFVGDVKSSFNMGTFPLYKEFGDLKKHNKMYYWQMQGYMWLTGLSKSILAYCLVDTPEEVIEGVRYKRMRELDVIDLPQEEEDRIRYEHNPSVWINPNTQEPYPAKSRVVQFPQEINLNDIEKLKERISLCRVYMKELSEYLHHKIQ
tara:strand:- start:4683 stop:5432 length:750 start_codon:yes stop_codon:yes gene_type:complete